MKLLKEIKDLEFDTFKTKTGKLGGGELER